MRLDALLKPSLADTKPGQLSQDPEVVGELLQPRQEDLLAVGQPALALFALGVAELDVDPASLSVGRGEVRPGLQGGAGALEGRDRVLGMPVEGGQVDLKVGASRGRLQGGLEGCQQRLRGLRRLREAAGAQVCEVDRGRVVGSERPRSLEVGLPLSARACDPAPSDVAG